MIRRVQGTKNMLLHDMFVYQSGLRREQGAKNDTIRRPRKTHNRSRYVSHVCGSRYVCSFWVSPVCFTICFTIFKMNAPKICLLFFSYIQSRLPTVVIPAVIPGVESNFYFTPSNNSHKGKGSPR